ncbi:30S ribosomal protein S9, mitochondrial [Cajanus cajan]|uniref:30S ribosomal protein S9, mitochondrial n=1 Tax=Cajanus cajan TaxID=3821 RepID=UPI00098DC4E2|nr:30S ribosomal protein S9, mitochondrial [Cajanus cajan]
MLSRLIPKPYHFRRFLSLPLKPPQFPAAPHFSAIVPKHFSTGGGDSGDGKDPFSSRVWKDFRENEEKLDAFFEEEVEGGSLAGVKEDGGRREERGWLEEDQGWLQEKGLDDKDEDAIFKGIEEESGDTVVGGGGFDESNFGGDFKPWSLKGEEEEKEDVFNFKEEDVGLEGDFTALDIKPKVDVEQLEKEEQALTAVVKGPKRAFGDLIAASGITDEMLDSLIALKDFDGVDGLPPLSVIEDMRYEKNTRKSTRAEMERLKQEEAAKARVKQVDEKGRAYGTGRRKCSVARVWVQPGNGKFLVNDKEFDVYFPMLDHRATLLRPFSETKTLGLWDVNCTVKGGGVSGQVGAIRLGISKALQNWEPDLRPALRNAGFLTRDSRVVERKKPGKAKARKSFQWVKR